MHIERTGACQGSLAALGTPWSNGSSREAACADDATCTSAKDVASCTGAKDATTGTGAKEAAPCAGDEGAAYADDTAHTSAGEDVCRHRRRQP